MKRHILITVCKEGDTWYLMANKSVSKAKGKHVVTKGNDKSHFPTC
jgi:hypothetical protein